jgi:hypothetical protein
LALLGLRPAQMVSQDVVCLGVGERADQVARL